MLNAFFLWSSLLAVGIAMIMNVINIIALSYMAKGAPYLETTEKDIERLIPLLPTGSGLKAADIGSGDGRIVIALAKHGIEAHGYEINPLLIKTSKKNIQDAGLENRATIYWQNFWKADISQYDIITVFGVGFIMKRLEKKLQKELKPGATIVSFRFPFHAWPLQEKHEAIYIYKK